MGPPSLADDQEAGAAPIVALLDCGPEEATSQLAALGELAARLGVVIQTERVSAGCVMLSVRMAPDHVRRFQAALLLGGATLLPMRRGMETDVTVIVTTSARPARSE